MTTLTPSTDSCPLIEFYFYYVCFIVIVPYMFYVAHSVSKGMSGKNIRKRRGLMNSLLSMSPIETSPHYEEYASRLSEGWIFGRKVVKNTPFGGKWDVQKLNLLT